MSLLNLNCSTYALLIYIYINNLD